MAQFEINFPEGALDLNLNPLPAELCSKYPLEGLPTQSVIFDGNNQNRFWTVMGAEGIMAPAPDSGLDVRSVFQSGGFPNGTTARVPTIILVPTRGLVDFVKMNDGWKRMPGGGVNVQLTNQLVVGQFGTGDFLTVHQPADYARGGQVNALQPLAPVDLRTPLVLAEDGVFEGSDEPAFGNIGTTTRKLSIVVPVTVSTGATVTYSSPQHTVWKKGQSVTKGILAMHAARALTNLMAQEKGSPLCINGMEIHPDDLLLVALKQVSQGRLQAEIAVRNF
ncbi:hypothetical protein V8D89_003016 [Ganoderma adspersum]